MRELLTRMRARAAAKPHWFALACILLAFARLAFDLDAKTLWWDESLSLQRAEQGWRDLLAGKLILWDNERERVTWDQHPFAYFALLGAWLRLTDATPFLLRFPSLLAAVLFVPVVWRFALFLQQKQLAPRHTSYWAAALAAINPFLLWYGQEARPYALWMLASLTAFWALWQWMDTWAYAQGKFRHRPRWAWLYLLAMLLALTTHFYAIMMIPIHGLFIAAYMLRIDRKFAIEIMTFLLLLAGALAFAVYRLIITQPGAGSNYAAMDLWTIGREMLHAFGTGLSTRPERVAWLDGAFLLLAAYGIWHSVASPERRRGKGWFLGVYLLLPVACLFAASVVQPNYMAARHHAQMIGVFLLAAASGLAALSAYHFRATAVCAALIFGSSLYSSYRYFESPSYGKAPDYALVGRILEDRLRAGDLVVFKGPNSWRLFRYFFPMEEIEAAQAQGIRVDWKGMPFLRANEPQLPTDDRLRALADEYDRIWMVDDRTLPYEDPQHTVLSWLRAHMHEHGKWEFFHPNSSLALFLFLPADPNPVQELPAAADVAVGATFGASYRLQRIEIGRRLWATSQLPLTLYWDMLDAPPAVYRYIAWLEEVGPDGARIKLPHTEMAGAFPADAGHLMLDYSHVEAPLHWQEDRQYLLHVMLYDVSNGNKLAITDPAAFQAKDDEPALVIPLPLRAEHLGSARG